MGRETDPCRNSPQIMYPRSFHNPELPFPPRSPRTRRFSADFETRSSPPFRPRNLFPKVKLPIPICGTRCFNPSEPLTYHLQMDEYRDLLDRVGKGDMAAFEQLVGMHQPFAYRLAVRLLCSEAEAEDAVQEAFVRVWRNIRRYDPAVLFTTWLYRIVTNLCLDQLRRRKRQRAFVNSGPSDVGAGADPPGDLNIEDAVSTADLVRIVKAIAGSLPETQRLVFLLRDVQDLSIQEVRQITGLSEASIKTNLHYARRAVRERMGSEYGIRGNQ